MPLTRLQYQTRIQQNLNDATGVFFSASDCADSMQDGYDEILLETQCYESVASITFDAKKMYYDVYNGVPNFWRPVRMFSKASNRWIRFVDVNYLDKLRNDWELANAAPWWAYIVNFQYIGLFPHYTPAIANSFDLFYKVGKDTLTSDSQLVQIPDPFNSLLENYATADLLETISEFKKAQTYWADYNADLERLRVHVVSRMNSLFDRNLNDLSVNQ